MRVRVLGNTDRYLAPRSGGSGYLVESGSTRILLDCGGGIADALAGERFDAVASPRRDLSKASDPSSTLALDALVISHFHHDHVLDLMRLVDSIPKGTPIVIPPGEAHRLDELARAFAFRGAFHLPGPLHEARPEAPLRVGEVELEFAPTQHSAPSFATRIGPPRAGASGSSADASGPFVYASDTTSCQSLVDLARGCDVLIMHTLLPHVDPASNHAARHSTAHTAGQLAARAGARRLVLSHRYHEARDADMLAAAGAHHPRVELARAGMIIDS